MTLVFDAAVGSFIKTTNLSYFISLMGLNVEFAVSAGAGSWVKLEGTLFPFF